mmetsp:Transcript_80079/g.194137  ORF Transcript_80079/g.194137 Transcript_80079/m.194137 type:complete len:337 (-) Transcript_80079:316-1326(-)
MQIFRTILVVATWFTFNVSMSTVMKWTYMYGKVCTVDGNNCQAYKFPFMMTAVHMLFCWMVCFVLVRIRPGAEDRVCMTFKRQIMKIAPLAICFSLSVGAGNLSLKYIYPSFSQMLSSITPLITVLVAVVLRGTRFNSWTWASMPVICGGLLVCGAQEVNFDINGATLAVVATVLRAMKAVMQEKLLDPKEKDMDSVTLLYYLAPYAGVFLVSMSLACEGADPIIFLYPYRNGEPTTGVPQLLMLLSFSGINACFLNISGNLVTAHMGAVMMQILGNLKACISIVISVAIFRNPVSPVQMAGVAVCLFGVWIYNSKGGVATPAKVEVADEESSKGS